MQRCVGKINYQYKNNHSFLKICMIMQCKSGNIYPYRFTWYLQINTFLKDFKKWPAGRYLYYSFH